MSIGLIFWVLMLLWLIFGFWQWGPYNQANYAPFGGHILLWFLLFLLGWHEFGFIVRG